MANDPHKKVSDDYNDLPFETRVIAGRVLTTTRISQLHIEKDRLQRSYRRSLKEINDHIKTLEADLEKDIGYAD